MYINNKSIFMALLAFISLSAYSATDSTSSAPTTPAIAPAANSVTSPPASNGNQSSRIANQYSDWTGSLSNAQSLVNGLRTGSPITLQPTLTSSGTPTTGVTFTAPTKNMGWGNITKALSLAKADLAAAGITNPTPAQLQAALTGGDITLTQGTTTQTTHMDGILTMRSQGMGWGQIAHNLNLHPGTAFKSGTEAHGSSSHHTHTLKNAKVEEAESQELHHAQTISGSATESVSHGTTASGIKSGSGQPVDHQSSQVTHTQINRVVSATGAPLSAGSSYQHVSYGSDHVAAQSVSHVSTAAADGNGGGLGKSMGHGKN